MKKTIGLKNYKSNGKFYEFYQFNDLPKSVRKELLNGASDKNSIECDQYLHIQKRWYGVSDFLTTYHNPWLGSFATEYHENNIHGLYANDYDIAIEVSNCNTMYRSWTV